MLTPMQKLTTNWQHRDRVSRLALGRENALRARGVRWAAPRDGTDKQKTKAMRREEITKEGSRSLIERPTAFMTNTHDTKKKDK